MKKRSDVQMCSDIWRIEYSSLDIYLLGINFFQSLPDVYLNIIMATIN